MPESLVRPLFSGPIDIIGDIHGERTVLMTLLEQLGYDDAGRHPAGRRLVFLGDMVDRGPDSIGVVDLVQRLVESNVAQCVLGNHELNLLLDRKRAGNAWFFGEPEALAGSDRITPQKLADEHDRSRLLDFFATLPLVLERPDVRVVHACWNRDAVEAVRPLHNVLATFHEHRARIEAFVEANGLEPIAAKLRHQLENPVKLLTSGPERRTESPFEASGSMRYLERVPWWVDYADSPYCVFGHYAAGPSGQAGDGHAICADFGIAARWRERIEREELPSGTGGDFTTRLAAVRFPEKTILLDSGEAIAFGE